jgi:hypothetical protein
MAQPFVAPCSRGLIDAQPCPRALGREIADSRKRVVLAAEGWGWCYVDESFVDLPDTTPQNGPIPRYV